MTSIELMERVMARRRADGLTVVFRRLDGSWDEWGFNSADRRDAYINGLAAAGREYHVPAWQTA